MQRLLSLSPTLLLASVSLVSLTTPTTWAFAPSLDSSRVSPKSTTQLRGQDRANLQDSDEWLKSAVQSTMDEGGFDSTSFAVGILGDLHIDPRKMEDYYTGRDHWMPIFKAAKKAHGNVALVSLGDLGESKNCDHNPANPSELFAGTSLCHEIAAEYLGSFGVPYEVIGGNHGMCFVSNLILSNWKYMLLKTKEPCQNFKNLYLTPSIFHTMHRPRRH